MLEIYVPGNEFWDSSKEIFIKTKPQKICLEHSLVSIYKWEDKYERSFLNSSEMSYEEILYYVKCMTITQNVDDNLYYSLTEDNWKEIIDYIEKPHTATKINHNKNAPKNREIITSEIIYYWMISLGIPLDCQKWNFNKLMTLIEVCSIKNQPKKKMSNRDIYKSNSAINKARREARRSKG